MSHVIPPSIEMLQMDEALAKLTPVADVLVAMAKGQSEPDGYPPLPMGSDADSYVGEAKVFSHDEMRAYVDADRALRAAPQAAPAAVAVQLDANGIAPCPLCGSESKHVKANVGGHRILCWNDDCECSSGYFCSKEEAITSWNDRAALAATPEAAPVVLPEPVGAIAWNRDGERPTFHAGCTNKELLRLKLNEGLTGGPYRTEFAFTEPQLRALLATGGQAQAVATLTEEALAEKIRSHGAYGGLAAHLMPFIAQHAAPQAQADAREANVQWWLADIDQYGNPALTDGAHSDRAGADKAAYLINAMGLGQGRKFAVARVELSDPKPSAEDVNHEAIAQNNRAAIAAAKGE